MSAVAESAMAESLVAAESVLAAESAASAADIGVGAVDVS